MVRDRRPGRADAGRHRRVRNNPAVPHGLDQFVLGDDAVTVLNDVGQKVENLGLQRHERSAPAQLTPITVQYKILEEKSNLGPLALRALTLSRQRDEDLEITRRKTTRSREEAESSPKVRRGLPLVPPMSLRWSRSNDRAKEDHMKFKVSVVAVSLLLFTAEAAAQDALSRARSDWRQPASSGWLS